MSVGLQRGDCSAQVCGGWLQCQQQKGKAKRSDSSSSLIWKNITSTRGRSRGKMSCDAAPLLCAGSADRGGRGGWWRLLRGHWQRWVLLLLLLSLPEAEFFQTDQLVVVCPKRPAFLLCIKQRNRTNLERVRYCVVSAPYPLHPNKSYNSCHLCKCSG